MCPKVWEVTASLVAQTVKRVPIVRETQVQSLGWEDPLEKEMATHSSTLAWKIPWTEEPSRLQSMGSQRVRRDWANSLHFTSVNTQWILVSFPNERIKVVPLALEYPTQISMVALDHMVILSQRKSLLRSLWWCRGREDPTCLGATKPVHHSHSAQCSQNNLIVF